MTTEQSFSVCFFSHSALLVGAERSLLELVTELIRDHGVICSVFLPDDGPLREKLDQAGASTHIVQYAWWCDANLPSDDEITRRLNRDFQTTVEHIEEKVRNINPDIIVTNAMVIPWGAIIASLLNKPHVWFIREFGTLDHDLKFFFPFQRILGMIRDSSNLILTNSNAVREFAENGYAFAKENFTKAEYGGRVYELLKDLRNTPNPCSSSYFQFLTRNIVETIRQKNTRIAHLDGLTNQKEAEVESLRAGLDREGIAHPHLESVIWRLS